MGTRDQLARLARRIDRSISARAGDDAEVGHQLTAVQQQLDELRNVVRSLQEELDRWAEATTASLDALGERLTALERRHERGTA